MIRSRVAQIFSSAFALAICPGAPAFASDRYTIKQVRWEEDYSYLAAPDAKPRGLERLKYIPLSADGTFWLSLGGEIKNRLDVIDNAQFALRSQATYTVYQLRTLLHGDLHIAKWFRVFAQFGYFDEKGRKPAPRSYDISAVDLQQGFADVSPASFARLRIGRQELPLGDLRLSDLRDGYNIRRSFDAARADLQITNLQLTGFWGQPVLNRKGLFDDRAAKGESFYGVYATLAGPALWASVDAYWLVRVKPNAVFSDGTARERRDTFGARVYGALGGWDYNVQGLVQTGRFGTGRILAYAATSDIGWTATAWPWTPRLGVRADFGSGDLKRGDNVLNSFDAPYPNTSYLSLTSAYWPGNAWSLSAIGVAKPDDKTTVYLGAQYMARASTQDGFYYGPESPISLAGSGARGLMTEVYSRVRWEPTLHWTLSGTMLYQFAGTATRAVGGKNVAIGSMSVDWRF
ncbi:MAG: alginate export family protein [Proteobacteria bacterium]|nr:alginate export family protein [Pseudomonadota bacterium]